MLILRTHAELADLCRQLRENAGLTQQELATRIGANNIQDISNAENVRQKSRFAMRKRILEYFGRSVQECYLVEEQKASSAV